MPMTLFTGLPGNGKTLYALQWVEEKLRAPVIEGGPRRPVFYRGIKGLTLDWTELEPQKWQDLPPGSIMVIDECQDVFPPRGRGEPDEWIRDLTKHRHGGVDLVLITQHPMLFDSYVRRLCDRHFHLMRNFGFNRATVHEFPTGVRDNVEKSRTGSVRHEWSYPKHVFSWYQSAELHTVKRRLPARVYVLMASPVVFAVLAWLIWTRLMPNRASAEAPLASATAASAARADPAGRRGAQGAGPVRDLIALHAPRVPGMEYTAPIYDEVTKPVQAPYPAACVQMGQRCGCYTQQGTQLATPADLCAAIVAKGFFVSWQQLQPQQVRAVAAVPKQEQPPPSWGINSGAPSPLPSPVADAGGSQQQQQQQRVRR